jgi:dTDP-4-dehydrorhamnose reductase
MGLDGKKKVALIGARGQLGCALQANPDIRDFDLTALSHSELDLTQENQVFDVLGQLQPDTVINAAAYTAVDKAESEQDTAFMVNARGPELLAAAAKRMGFNIVHISTDFVFDGTKSRPYQPNDETAPVSIYGKSKLAGEQALLGESDVAAAVVRTSWLYSSTHPCFLATMLKLMATRPSLSIVADQVGTPTSVCSLSRVIIDLLKAHELPQGIFHWSDAGVASWYDFAHAIQNIALAEGLLEQAADLKPIATEEYPTPAQRPSYSVLDKTSLYELLGISAPKHWQTELGLTLKKMI